MIRRTTLFFSVFLAACGGGTSDGGVADTAPDGTADTAAEASTDAAKDAADTSTPPPDTTSGDALLGDSSEVGDASEVGDVATDAACTDCVGDKVTWGNAGGLVAFVDSSSVSPCRAYLHERRTAGSPSTVKASCTLDVLACGKGDAPNVGDLEAVLRDPDVQAALAKAPILYGTDPRAFDGSVFSLGVGTKTLEVGGACSSGASGCVAIPPGVQKAVDFLRNLDTVELSTTACAGKFTP